MNVTTAVLCTRPALGLALYFLNLCASNQALHDVFIDLGHAGVVATQQVDAPMDELYNLVLWRVPVQTKRPYDHTLEFACPRPEAPISLTLKVSHGDEPAIETRTFDATCPTRHGEDPSLVHLGQLRLKKGRIKLVIQNNLPIALAHDSRVQVLLVGNGVPG